MLLTPLVTLSMLVLAQAPAVTARAVTIRAIDDVITQWSADQHLYVRGNLGIGDEQLSRLETWLDENGPHWTVVLLQNAHNDLYVTPDRRTYRDLDAVEYALGHGLANRTGFGELEHPVTGETDGAVFVLFLEERKFSYYGSDAHDRRELGEAQWVGELDVPAIRAMRGGGRILDAVKDTVLTINRRLNERIADEQKEAARVQRERQRTMEELKDDLQIAQAKLAQVVQEAAEFRGNYPQADGELAQPPLEPWQTRLAEIAQEANEENVRGKITQVSQLITGLDGLLNSYADQRALDDTVAALRQRIETLSDVTGVARPLIDEANGLIEQALQKRQKGERGLAAVIDSVTAALDRADQAVQQEQARLRAEAVRHQVVQNTLLAASGLAALVGLVVLCFLNRRRLPARKRALQALQGRETSVKAEMDRVLQLFSRGNEILGSKERIVERGYAGDTLAMSHRALENIDDLLIMSNEVERVMREARELIFPQSWWASVANLISGARYEQGIHRMTGEPLRFLRNQGLPAILADDAARAANGDPPEEITATFEKVIGAFHDRCQDTSALFDSIENSLVQVNDRLHELRQKVDEVTAVDRELNDLHAADGLMNVPNLFEKLLPAAHADYDRADEIAGSDPVRAMQHYLPNGFRKLEAALAVADALRRARRELFPRFDQHAPILRSLGYSTDWIATTIATLGAEANALFAAMSEGSVNDQVTRFDTSLTELATRVGRTAELAQQLHEVQEPLLRQVAEAVAQARHETAARLNIDAGAALREVDADPDVHLQAARQQFTSAQASLQQGTPDAAVQAIEALRHAAEQAQAIVTATLQGLGEFADQLRARQHQLQMLEQRLPERERALPAARQVYASSAMRLQAGDPAYPDPAATLESHLRNCHECVDQTRHELAEAERIYREGRVLQAVGTVQSRDRTLQQADKFLDEIDAHTSRLQSQTLANQALVQQLQDHARDLQSQVNDRRTMQATLTEHAQSLQAVEQADRQIHQATAARDPFENAQLLGEVQGRLQRIEAAVAADRNAHVEASRAVAGAEGQVAIALRLVQQAGTDNIPDSAATTASIHEIRSLNASVQSLRRQLDVPHGDWKLVDEQATHLQAQLGVEAGRLRGELDTAQQSAAALEQASREVFRASGWTGAYGIRIGGTPGAAELERARRALQGGDYGMMIELARAAAMAAQYAVQQAEREVERHRREDQRRLEAERRRQMQSIGGTTGGIGGGWSGGPSSSSAPSSSSSSSPPPPASASGSGFSRSGW